MATYLICFILQRIRHPHRSCFLGDTTGSIVLVSDRLCNQWTDIPVLSSSDTNHCDYIMQVGSHNTFDDIGDILEAHHI
jgi:hypothetical protein